jgi:glutamyl-tRNA synthetase
MPELVTRFAPSPTGYLHVGGARTALFNWLLARHYGGKFYLRIEDTDLARSTESAVSAVIADLSWLGLKWDNAQNLMFQSHRTATYNRIIDDLKACGRAYDAWESPQELASMREQAMRAKRPFLYRRPSYNEEQLRRYRDEGRTPVVRFAMEVKDYWFDDAVLGPHQGLDSRQIQDFVIRKADGMPTYHFAVVVDDAEMGITHILRGQEHLLNTVNHIGLMEALGYERPTFAHLPVILKTDGSKMGKRDRDKLVKEAVRKAATSDEYQNTIAARAGLDVDKLVRWMDDDNVQLDPDDQSKLMRLVGLQETDVPQISVHDFRKAGYLPEVLNNFLALLGWSSGTDRERYSMDELVQVFTLERVGRANAKFDYKKLAAFNTETCSHVSPDRLLEGLRDYLTCNPDSPLNSASDDQLREILRMNAGFHIFADVDQKSRFFFLDDAAVAYDPSAVEKVLRKGQPSGIDLLRELQRRLASVAQWTHDSLEATAKALCEEKQVGLGKVAQPARVAVSGGTVSPPIFDTLSFLGRGRVLARMDRCLALAG